VDVDGLTTPSRAAIVVTYETNTSQEVAMLFKSVGGLPTWCTAVVVIASVVLAAIRVIVTQIIRLRAERKITTSAHALRVLRLETQDTNN
jgi:hypothetical protein